jgi:hypothetical protein
MTHQNQIHHTKALDAARNGELAITALIGLYINRSCGTDCTPVGRVIGTKGTKTLILQPIESKLINKEDLKFNVGGFAAHCENQTEQRYEHNLVGKPFEFKIYKNDHYTWSSEQPAKFWDYNF